EQERERAESAEQALQQAELAQETEAQKRRDAIPRLLGMGLSVEQVAEALSVSVEDVRQNSQP
ncbi:MAG TPA: hypothetical protein DD379_23540, partial [Cyanobacteria bacterium UBA11162]|nr:hypothetical protein [Cyanobacteria bacterium UBA11162]